MAENKKSLFRRVWKGFWQSLFRFGLFQWIVAGIIALIIWGIYFTCWVRFSNLETFKKYRKKPAIFVFWHGRSMLLSPIVCLRGMHSYAIASKHKDGQIMAKLQKLFGLKNICGSTSDGGLSVLRQGVRVLRKGGYSLCISPDGPGGPSLRVQEGAVYFAKMTGAPIIPVCFSASHAWFQTRWDRYLVALPFSKVNCYVGQPMFVESDASADKVESVRKNLEDFMVKQVHLMDAEFGFKPVEQDLTAREFKRKLREERAMRKIKVKNK